MQANRSSGARKGRAWWPILLGAVGLGLATWLGMAWFGPADVPPDRGREIAEAFLGELRAGRVDSAWKETTAEFKSDMGLERLRRYVKAHPTLKGPAAFAEFRKVSSNGLETAECTFQPAKGPSAIKVLLAQEEGQWRVERISAD